MRRATGVGGSLYVKYSLPGKIRSRISSIVFKRVIRSPFLPVYMIVHLCYVRSIPPCTWPASPLDLHEGLNQKRLSLSSRAISANC